MCDFDEIESLKKGPEKTEKLTKYYEETVKIDSWLNNNEKNSVIRFHDRTEYKRGIHYHRLNGPAIDYDNDSLDKYYYRGKLYENKQEWTKDTIKELRRIKIKKLNRSEISTEEK